MTKTGLKMLSSYEKAVISNKKGKTKGERAIEDAMTKETIKRMLHIPFSHRLEDGTEVVATAEECIVAAAIGDTMDKGSFEKVATMMKTTGEISNTIEVKGEVSLVDEDLAKRALN